MIWKGQAMSTTMTEVVKFSVEVITLPVSDIDRALRFYVDQAGFTLDVDYAPNDSFRVVQLTPPGSGCSIQIGKAITSAPAGSAQNIYLVVNDIEVARNQLSEHGVGVGDIRHKTPIGAWDGSFAPASIPHERITPASASSPTRTAIVGCCKSGVTAIHRE